jgi:hypothetical protein
MPKMLSLLMPMIMAAPVAGSSGEAEAAAKTRLPGWKIVTLS